MRTPLVYVFGGLAVVAVAGWLLSQRANRSETPAITAFVMDSIDVEQPPRGGQPQEEKATPKPSAPPFVDVRASEFDPAVRTPAHPPPPPRRGDARVIDLAEVAWLRARLDEAKGAGERLAPPPSIQLATVQMNDLIKRVRLVEPEVYSWPEDAMAVLRRGTGSSLDLAVLLAERLLATGYRAVGVRYGVPPPPRGGVCAWVVVWVNGTEWTLDPALGGIAERAMSRPKEGVSVVATVTPSSIAE